MTNQNQSLFTSTLIKFIILCVSVISLNAQVADTLDIPRLEKEIGQMLMVGIRGTHLNAKAMAHSREQLQNGEVGGILFFKHNIKNSRQFRIFVKSIASLPTDLPIFLAVDQEGGRVRRLAEEQGFEEFPSAAHVGANYKQNAAYDLYLRMAQQIQELGLNVNLAPVVDVNINKVSPAIGQLNRSFSRNPGMVYEFGSTFVNAHREAKVLTTLKHYPGHGSSREDTHNELTDITFTWRSSEKLPFQRLIDSAQVDMIMAGHLFDKDKDKKYPASLSKSHIQNTLRNELGYEGVVVTDDLQMGAIIKLYELDEIIIAAINAGCDILQFSDPENLHEDLPAYIRELVIQAIRDGQISEARIHESYDRIVALKASLKPSTP